MTNKKINNYADLLHEQESLEELLQAQKELVVYDFKLLKEEFKPATHALNLMGKLTTRERSNIFLNEASSRAIDLVLRKLVLGRAGWMTRFLVPTLIKNYSSHFIAEHKQQFMDKLSSWIGHKNGNGKAVQEVHSQGN